MRTQNIEPSMLVNATKTVQTDDVRVKSVEFPAVQNATMDKILFVQISIKNPLLVGHIPSSQNRWRINMNKIHCQLILLT